jgi:ornithine cyclodeaminase/alanine dehydrogenase-like protein (mu-crystallin family)
MAGKKTSLLYLSEQDMLKAGVLDGKQCVETIDEMFKVVGEGDYLMGGLSGNEHGQRLYFPVEKLFPTMPVAGPDRRFMAMIAYLGGAFNVCAEKWYGSNIENPKRGLPRSVLIVVLNNVETGEPFAFMSANLLSAMRTGAVPAVGAKYLASKEAKTVAVIGAGVISRATITCMKAALPNLTKAIVYDINTEKARSFCTQMSNELGFSFKVATSMEEAVRASDVITIATAGGSKPILKKDWVKPNALIATQGTADIPDDLFTSSRIVFDEIKMHRTWKEEEESIPESQAAKRLGFPGSGVFRLCEQGKIDESSLSSLSEIAFGKKPGRTREDQRFILIIGGLPVEDAAWGTALYRNAIKKSLGQELVLWEEPHWL